MSKKIKAFTKKQIQEAVIKLTGDEDVNSESNNVGYILLASLEKGANETEIAKLLSLDEKFVIKVGKRLRKNGVWTKKGKVCCSWFDEETNIVAFNMDICVGMGWVERKENK